MRKDSSNWSKLSVEKWDQQATKWSDMDHIWEEGSRAQILSFFFDFIGKNQQHILDLGCGPGASTKLMKEKGHKTVGTDHSEEMVQKARERGIESKVCSENRLPYSDDSFDVVFACTSLEWTDHPHLLIKEASRVLKQGGKFVAVTLGPYARPRKNAYDRLYGKEVIHNMMMPWELHQLLEEHGFEHNDNFGTYSGKNAPNSDVIQALGDNWVAKSSLSFLYAFATIKR